MNSAGQASILAFERACKVIPGGVNSPARAFKSVGGSPIVMDRANGPYLTDVDGRCYIDYIGSWGPMILGHQHPNVLSAISEQLGKATSFGAPCTLETNLAELVVQTVPSVEMVRFTSSGTEAAMSACRLARGFTKRDKLIKISGCYHGHVDALLVKAGSAATTLGTPSSPGVPAGCTQDTLLVEYNDLAGVEELFSQYPDQIAAVLLEPLPGNMGLVLPADGYLQGLRQITQKHGSLLIFDEVMTGFRITKSGFQGAVGIKPDMTIFGKVIGGGLPVGAYGGRRDIMSYVSPAGPVFQAGTLSGNPLAMAAGLATLTTLFELDPFDRLNQATQRLAQGFKELAQTAGHEVYITQLGSMLTIFFQAGPVTDYSSALQSDTRKFADFFWLMMNRGVYLPCSQYEAWFVGCQHDDRIIEQTLAAAEESFAELKAG